MRWMPLPSGSARTFDGEHGTLDLVVDVHQLADGGRVGVDHVVAEHDGEGLIADEVAGDVHGVAEAARRSLPDGAEAGQRGDVTDGRELIELAAVFEQGLELDVDVEVIDHRRLAARGHEHDLFDAGRHGFLDGVLNDGLVDQRQHFLRHGLGGRKEPGAKARRREHRRSDPVLHALPPSRGAVTLAHAIGWEARRAHVQ